LDITVSIARDLARLKSRDDDTIVARTYERASRMPTANANGLRLENWRIAATAIRMRVWRVQIFTWPARASCRRRAPARLRFTA